MSVHDDGTMCIIKVGNLFYVIAYLHVSIKDSKISETDKGLTEYDFEFFKANT